MKRALVIAALLLLPLLSHAGEWGLVLHGASLHFQARDRAPWNQANDGFGIRYMVSHDLAFQAGHYRNSQTLPTFNFFTNYLVADYTPLHRGPFDFGGFAGAASGYDDYDFWTAPNGQVTKTVITKEQPVIPVAGLLARFNFNVFQVTARVAPNILAIEGGFRF